MILWRRDRPRGGPTSTASWTCGCSGDKQMVGCCYCYCCCQNAVRCDAVAVQGDLQTFPDTAGIVVGFRRRRDLRGVCAEISKTLIAPEELF